MQRRRVKQTVSLKDRLASFAEQLKAEAIKLRPGPEQDALLKRARQADTASHIDEWVNSPGYGRRSNTVVCEYSHERLPSVYWKASEGCGRGRADPRLGYRSHEARDVRPAEPTSKPVSQRS